MTTQDKEPIVDWQLEYMKLAKEFLQYIVNVHTVIPEYRTIANLISEGQNEKRKEMKEEMIKFLFKRYGIEYNTENLKKYYQAEYDYWGECLDGRDTEDGGVYIPPHPTTTHLILYALCWSNLVQGEDFNQLLDRDCEDADFRLPGDHSESRRSEHYYPEDREDRIADLSKYAEYLNVETFIGNLKPLGDDPKKILDEVGLEKGCASWFTSCEVTSWINWRKNH